MRPSGSSIEPASGNARIGFRNPLAALGLGHDGMEDSRNDVENNYAGYFCAKSGSNCWACCVKGLLCATGTNHKNGPRPSKTGSGGGQPGSPPGGAGGGGGGGNGGTTPDFGDATNLAVLVGPDGRKRQQCYNPLPPGAMGPPYVLVDPPPEGDDTEVLTITSRTELEDFLYRLFKTGKRISGGR